MKEDTVNLRVEHSTIEKFKAICKQQKTDPSKVIRSFIKRYVDAFESVAPKQTQPPYRVAGNEYEVLCPFCKHYFSTLLLPPHIQDHLNSLDKISI